MGRTELPSERRAVIFWWGEKHDDEMNSSLDSFDWTIQKKKFGPSLSIVVIHKNYFCIAKQKINRQKVMKSQRKAIL